ncbi:MAG: RrF2 family transcriptional regulator [Lachnospiraceae bacterium]
MRVSTKGRYGLKALVDVTINEKEGCVSLVNIANRNQISLPYLEHVFASLKKAGIVRSIKGPQGGYMLEESPDKITISSILTALDGDYRVANEQPEDAQVSVYVSKAIDSLIWEPVNKSLSEILENTTLKDLTDEYIRVSQSDQIMYYI